MAAGSTLWHVQGGNSLVPKQLLERLLQQSNVQFVQGHVKSVSEVHRIDPDDQGGAVRLSYQPANSELVHTVDYDYVVLAFPLHRDNVNDFVFQSNTGQFNQHDYRMQTTYSNFLSGKLPCQKYNLTNDACNKLTAIFYTNPSLSYRSLAQQRQVNEMKKQTNNAIYKIFSPVKLDSADYVKVFDDQSSYRVIEEMPWLAYPKYQYPQKLPPIQLDENVFYVNAMEWSASCMEIEAISARNVAMLLTKKLGVQLRQTDKHVEF